MIKTKAKCIKIDVLNRKMLKRIVKITYVISFWLSIQFSINELKTK